MNRKIRGGLILMLVCFTAVSLPAQDGAAVLKKIRAKIDLVNDYSATGQMKTNISFLKVPDAEVKVYFKKPNHLRILNEQGVSLVPKGTVNISLGNLLNGDYQVLDAGTDNHSGATLQIIKLLPRDENAELVLTTLYIDVQRLLIIRARTTTRSSGTSELEMSYGKYSTLALPDKVIFTFNTQEYKLPKGVTFDYDNGTNAKKPAATGKSNLGRIEINYGDYRINKGISDAVFDN